MALVVGCKDTIPSETRESQVKSESAITGDVSIPESSAPTSNDDRHSASDDQTAPSGDQASVSNHVARPSSDGPVNPEALDSKVHAIVPNLVPSVRIYPFLSIDWPPFAIRHPGQTVSIIARGSRLPFDEESSWLMVETLDGDRGWVTADALQPKVVDLIGLPRLELVDVLGVTETRGSTPIHRASTHASSGCLLDAGVNLEVAGRSPDGQWLLVRPINGSCLDSNEREMWRGWIPITAVLHDLVIEGAPVIYDYGLWLFPANSSEQPKRLPVHVHEGWSSEAWRFDSDDQSLVYLDLDDPEGPRLKRYTFKGSELATLAETGRGDILVAPTGGRVLVLSGSFSEDAASGLAPGFRLTIIERDGEEIEIGRAFLFCQCDREVLLSRQARWSPDGRTIVFRDWGIPDSAPAGHGAGEFWLYHVDDGERISLFDEDAGRPPKYDAAAFHPDGQSIYVLVGASGSRPSGYLVRRLTLDGEPWPGFQPVPADRLPSISPLGDRMISETNAVGLILTDQGELLGARVGWYFQWHQDGRRFSFLTHKQWEIGSISSSHSHAIPISNLSRWRPLSLSPDGNLVAVVTSAYTGPHPWSEVRQVRIYGLDGRLRSMYRITGCDRLQWLSDSSTLAVSVFPFCGVP
jgi:hypothetical protein